MTLKDLDAIESKAKQSYTMGLLRARDILFLIDTVRAQMQEIDELTREVAHYRMTPARSADN